MRNDLRQLKPLIILLIIITTFSNCNLPSGDKATTTPPVSSGNIEVFYFHYTRRCITCNAVEAEAQNALQLLYPEKVKSGDYSFISLNLDEEKGEAKAKQLGVSGQTLLIVKNGKQKNITNEGFMNARNNPKELHEVIKNAITEL